MMLMKPQGIEQSRIIVGQSSQVLKTLCNQVEWFLFRCEPAESSEEAKGEEEKPAEEEGEKKEEEAPAAEEAPAEEEKKDE